MRHVSVEVVDARALRLQRIPAKETPAMISLRTHSILDYGVAALLVVSPWIFGFATVDAARSVFFTAGLSLLAYSLITDYRYSVAKIVPVGVHMFMDVVLSILVMIAPAVFGYRDLITGG
jgi:hypothetical protein